MKCEHCNGTGQEPPRPLAADYVPKPRKTAPWFWKDRCAVLKMHKDCTDPSWAKFLSDGYKLNEITEGQWKFFSVIHNKILGHYPDWDEKQTEAPPLPPDWELPF